MMMPLILGMIPQASHALGDSVIIGDDRTGFAEAAQILSRIKPEAAYLSHRSDLLPFVPASVCLSCILDQFQSMAIGDFLQRVEVGRLAIEVHRYNGPGPSRYSLFHQ